MPIFEYECFACRGQFQALILHSAEERNLVCPQCGGLELKKLISRTVYHLSERDRLNAFDPAAGQSESFYKDSRNIGLRAQKRAQQMGVDLGDGFTHKLEKLRTDPGGVLKDD